MLELIRDIANVIFLLGCLFCIWRLSIVYRRTHASWVFLMMVPFAYLIVVRGLVLARNVVARDFSQLLLTGTIVLFSVAFWMFSRRVVEWTDDMDDDSN